MLCLTGLATSATAHDDVLSLSFELRQRCRQRVRLRSGQEVGLLLPRGVVLRSGDLLRSDDGGITVRVEAAPELLSIVRCEDALLLARVCYHLGNRHVALQIERNSVRYPHDHVLDAMVAGLGLRVETASLPFEPEPGAYTAVHEHGHEHSHEQLHDH
jgi:urease accessory protein